MCVRVSACPCVRVSARLAICSRTAASAAFTAASAAPRSALARAASAAATARCCCANESVSSRVCAFRSLTCGVGGK